MHNPKNWKNSSRARSNCSKSGWISVLQEGVENVCCYVTCHVTLIGSWQSKHPKLHQAELPPCIQCTGVRQTNNGCVQLLCAGVFFLPSPSLSPILTRQPLPWNHFLTRSNSRSVSTSTPALQFSFAVTWDLTWDQAQFARFGFFRFHARRNVIYKAKTKIEHDLRLAL